MQSTKLQQIQRITQQNQQQQFKRTWTTRLILLGSSVGLGAILWTLPAVAATTPQVTAKPTTSSITTSAATKPNSVALSTANPVNTVASSASSAVPTSSAATTNATPTTNSTTSLATTTTSSVTQTSHTASSAGGTGFVLPSLAISAPSSAFGSSASGASSAATAGSTATSASTSQSSTSDSEAASLAALPDATIVNFADSGIEANILTDMATHGPITLGDIRHYTGATLAIGTPYVPLEITTSLAGMQYLQALPQTTLINFYSNYPNPNFDLSPLEHDRFRELSINVDDMSAMNLKPLLSIDPTTILSLQLNGSIKSDMSDYQNNPEGMTNAQLAEIAPWLTAIDNTSPDPAQTLDFNLSDNSLTDFSSLSGFTKPALFTALGQRLNYETIPVNFVIGQPGTFTAIPLIGMTGDSWTNHYSSTLSGSPTQALTDTTHPLEPAITSLGNSRFEIKTAYPTFPNSNWFAYGLAGEFNLTTVAQLYTNSVHTVYPNGTTFEYDGMIYQPANWLPAPELNIKYVDRTTGAEIQPATLIKGTTIGAAYDLTPQTKLSGYTFDAQRSSSPTGSYTQDPQALTFTFAQQPAGGITVSYLTEAGVPIAATTTINGNVGTAYQSEPLTLVGYTYQKSTTTVPTSGTLSAAAGTIDYIYTANPLTRTIKYLDVTTGQVLATDHITSTYMGTTSYRPTATIANYQAQGYDLVANNYPTDDSVFDNPTTKATYEIELAHQTVALTPTTPELPAGVTLQNKVSRTIQYVDLTNKTVTSPTIQSITFTRNAVRDLVTGHVTYGPWVATGTDRFGAVTSPILTNLTSNTAVTPAALAVPESTPDTLITVSYSPTRPASATSHVPTDTTMRTRRSLTKVAQPTPTIVRNRVPAATYQAATTKLATTTAPTRLQAKPTTVTSPHKLAAKAAKWAKPIASNLPQTSEQSTDASLLGFILIALASFLASLKRLIKRDA